MDYRRRNFISFLGKASLGAVLMPQFLISCGNNRIENKLVFLEHLKYQLRFAALFFFAAIKFKTKATIATIEDNTIIQTLSIAVVSQRSKTPSKGLMRPIRTTRVKKTAM